MQENVDT